MTELLNLLTRTSTIRFVLVIGMLTLTGVFGGALFFYPFPADNRDLINMFMIALTGWTTTIVSGYHNKPTPNMETPHERPRDVAEVESGIRPTVGTLQQDKQPE